MSISQLKALGKLVLEVNSSYPPLGSTAVNKEGIKESIKKVGLRYKAGKVNKCLSVKH